MKILFLADARSIHIQRWIQFFKEQGDQTYLVTLEEPAQEITETIYLQPKSSLNFAKYYLATREARELVCQIKPDLINAHFVPNYGLLGTKLGFKPLVVSVWGSDVLISAQKSIFHRLRASWVLKEANWLTSDSNYLTEEMAKLGANRDKISTFPMGLGQEFLNISQKHLSKKNEFTIISTRRLEPVYDLDLLIRAVPLIIERGNFKIRFLIVGEGSQKERLRELTRRLGVYEKVEFCGAVSPDNLIRLLTSSDLYVSTSLSDSTSVSLLEAMASGLIPIVTIIPGNREWIQEGVNGFLAPANRPEVLAEKIVSSCQNMAALQKIADRNQQMVREKANYQANLLLLRENFLQLVRKYKAS